MGKYPNAGSTLVSRRFTRNVLLSISGGVALTLAGQAAAHAQDAGTQSAGTGDTGTGDAATSPRTPPRPSRRPRAAPPRA
jgi:hypothetical protein